MELKEIERQQLFIKSEQAFLVQAKKSGLLTEEEYDHRLHLSSSHADQLSEEMKKHGIWKNHDTTVTFQHKTDNYLADKLGKVAWPQAQWDSEHGQGFAYCNVEQLFFIMEWLMQNGCYDVGYRPHGCSQVSYKPN